MTDDHRYAARGLLRAPLVLATVDLQLHRAVRRHEEDLASFFRTYLGYRLQVDARMARLYKAGLGEHTGRPFTRRGSVAFTPRDYAYLALTCSVFLTSRRQVLLSAVAEDVRQAAAEAGIEIATDTLAERRSLVHALRYLISIGALTEDAGSVNDFADDPSKEALLWVERDVMRALLSAPLREVGSPGDLVRVASEVDAESIRHTVRRKLVENPVVMLDDLTDAETAWLRQYQRREAQILEENLGLQLEIRAEGVAAFDPDDELTDVHFPRDGTLGQASLLAVADLVESLRPEPARGPGSSRAPIPAGLIDSVVAGQLSRHSTRWSKDYTARPDRLVADIDDLLLAVGLTDKASDGSRRLRAVAARYAPVPEVHDSLPPSFDLEDQ